MSIPIAAVVRFTHAWWPIALAGGLVPVAIAIWSRRRGRHVGVAAVVMQVVAITLAGVSLGGPNVPLGQEASRPHLVMRDVSASVRRQRRAELAWPADVPSETFEFAAAVGGEPHDGATNVAAALRLAMARRDELAGLVIQTDGQFHDDDWHDVADAVGRSGLKVVVVPMAAPPSDARVRISE